MSKKPNILLFNPWIEDFAAFDYWLKPMGLLRLADWLDQSNVHYHFFDSMFVQNPEAKSFLTEPLKRTPYGNGKLPKEVILNPEPLKKIRRRWGRYGLPLKFITSKLKEMPQMDVILVASSMTYWYHGLKNSIQLLREIFPHAKIIVGGIYASLCYDHACQNLGADYVVRNQSYEFLHKFFADNYEIQLKRVDPLRLSYPEHLYDYKELAVLNLSLGCPFKCTYCASKLFYPEFKIADFDFICREVDRFAEAGIKNLTFFDDGLLVNRENLLIPLLQYIQKQKYRFQLHLSNGVNLKLFTEELAYLFKEMNLITLRFGFESADTDCQKKLGGKVQNSDFLNSVKWLHDAGYTQKDIGMYMLCGYPHQRKEEVRYSMDYVLDHGARPYIAEYSPIPGTFLWEDSVKASPYDITNEPLFHNNSIMPCAWDGFTFDDLHVLKRHLRARLSSCQERG